MLIAHLTDLSPDDHESFVVAVALARKTGAGLVSVHACVDEMPPGPLPPARAIWERWGPSPEVAHEWVVHRCCESATDTLLDALSRLRPDLVVAATHARTGLSRLLSDSVAEGVARNISAPTLLLPDGGHEFVDSSSGTVHLERIVVAAGSEADAELAYAAAAAFAKVLGIGQGTIVAVHAEDGNAAPEPASLAGFLVSSRSVAAPLVDAVVRTADELSADLIVMPTRGHDGIGDVLFGSHTERVLHVARRPVLWVPAGGK